MSEKLRVGLDFDGTVTNADAEAARYHIVYQELLADHIEMGVYELGMYMDLARMEMTRNPTIYGWRYDGVIVAPATVDPYVETSTAAKLILGSLRISIDDEKLQAIHKEAYMHTDTVFRDNAKEVLHELHLDTNVTIVTNSETAMVEKKVQQLMGDDHGIAVIGDARKYMVNKTWYAQGLPATVQPPGFPRQLYLQREKYNTVLDTMGAEVVIGDIYEMDLALPEAKGIRTILLASPRTLPWEAAHYMGHPNGAVVSSLSEIPEKIAA